MLLVLSLAVVAHRTVSQPATSPTPATSQTSAGLELPSPILFATQVPIPADFATLGSVFANHLPDPESAGRGGDLVLLYPDGALRNLTAEAGFGVTGFQGAQSIAVRGPAVHWDGARALFSMVVGATEERYERVEARWQIYEVSGLGRGEKAVIRKVAHQPQDANNVSPVYDSLDRIVFVSDRPRGGEAHLYPQRDEYESTATPTGLWRLDPASGELILMQHSPSGSFTPIVDSFGRVVFTRWDHLQQDQQADADALDGDVYGSFDYAGESAGAARQARQDEVFPEPRSARTDLLAGTPFVGHTLNQFLPWEVRQDGTGEEVLNHLGRHELLSYFDRSRNDDPALAEFIAEVSGRSNPRSIDNALQLREDPTRPGRYVGTDAPEFDTHAAGQLIAFSASPGINADDVTVDYLTHPATREAVADGAPVPAGHSGHYRDPLPLSNGALIAAHTDEPRGAANEGTRQRPVPRYRFRLRRLVAGAAGADAYFRSGEALTPGSGLEKSVSYWDPDELVEYSGPLWELDPVEVRARPRPPLTAFALAPPEQRVLDELGISLDRLRADLRRRNLGLIVSRNVTSRDRADRQQPFNLRVPGGVETLGDGGKLYDVEHLQLFQADQVRGYGGVDSPEPGRRSLARPLHDPAAVEANGPSSGPSGGPEGSVEIAADGSIAAFVPAHRALAWQTTDGGGAPVVRERFWVSVQPGELRACDGCHGVNRLNQAGRPRADQPPLALRKLLLRWLAEQKTCTVDEHTLCFQGGRFSARATWRTNTASGLAHARPLTGDSGTFWFFDPANLEAIVKVLDACAPATGNRFWVFAAGLTNVEVTLIVDDLQSGESRTYVRPLGAPFQPIQDTQAFATCP